MQTVTLFAPDISCGHCVQTIQRAVGSLPGVVRVEGDPDTKRVTVVFDPQREWVVDPERFHSKGKNTPLAGQRLRGKVVLTLAEGRVAHLEDGARWRGEVDC